MSSDRPVNLNLWRMRFPITAIISILHRVSGVVLFLCLPLLLYILHNSLISQESFDKVTLFIEHPLVRLGLWISLVAVMFHLLAGIRHLMMDLGFGESLRVGRLSAMLVILLTILSSLFLGAWLWQL